MGARWWILSGLAAIAAAGCTPDPCDQDAIGCEDDGEFTLAPECELEGPLEVALGQGTWDFVALADSQEPRVHEGPQGGRHLCLAIRSGDPALDYPELHVTMRAELNDPERCVDQPEDCDPWIGTGDRQFVLGPELPLDEQGDVEISGIILIISIWPEDLERRVSLDVVDPCGRRGSFVHDIPPAS